MNAVVKASAVEVVKAIKTADQETIRLLFEELTLIQSIYVAAYAANELKECFGVDGNVLANLMIDNFCIDSLAGITKFTKDIDRGNFNGVFQQMTCETRSFAVAYVASLSVRRPEISQTFMRACQKYSEVA